MEISYKIAGLHSICSMPFIALKPVTILVGLNNSGKSSFLRSLPLLKQSVSNNRMINGDLISWQGDLVDFADFTTSVNRNSKDQKITFHFKISSLLLSEHLPDKKYRVFLQENVQLIRVLFPEFSEESLELRDISYSVTVQKFKNTAGDEFTILKRIKIEISNVGLHCEILFDKKNELKKIKINDVDLFELFECNEINFDNTSLLISELFFEIDKSKFCMTANDDEVFEKSSEFNFFDIFREVHSVLIHGHSRSSFEFMSNFKSVIKSFEDRRNRQSKGDHWLRCIYDSLSSGDKKKLKSYGNVLLFWIVFQRINKILDSTIAELTYLPPDRSIKRRHRHYPLRNINSLDPTAENLPSFLAGLGEKRLKKFSDWVMKIFGFGLDIVKANGQISVNASFDDKICNVADAGFGLSKLLPVLTQIWWAKHRTSRSRFKSHTASFTPQIIAMEQPELNLHPVQQAQVAEAVCDVITKRENRKSPNPRFIIETHSEKLVSKFSKLIRANKLNYTDIQVVVFATDREDFSNSTVKVCNFNKEGRLVNWPLGFFNSG